MLFNIESDSGPCITGYVVPDGFEAVPSIRVSGRGADLLTMEANETRESLVAAGRHATGLCGFRIDSSLIPDLESYDDLEIYDLMSDLQIYRRRDPDQVLNHKIFRLETHLLPLWRLDQTFEDKIQFWHPGADQFGRETATQLFLLTGSHSCYIAGRLFYKNYEAYLTDEFKTIVILQDPFDELAERLLLLSAMGKRIHDFLGDRDCLTFGPVIAALAENRFLEETKLRRFFRRLPAPAIERLANPQVRQLTAETPDGMPGFGSIPSALQTLSNFTVVGLRSDAAYARSAIAEALGLDPNSLPAMEEFPRVRQLGEQLKMIHSVESFLEQDLDLYHHIRHAFESLTIYENAAD